MTPSLRFLNYNNGWESANFGNVVTLSKEKYDPLTDTTNFPSVELESIASDGKLIKLFKSKSQKSLKNRFYKGDVLFGKLRPYLNKYLKATFDGVCSTEIWVLRGKEVIDSNFLYFLIQTARFREVVNIQSGSKMPRADWGLVGSSNFFLPSIEEQQKIASFLSSVDSWLENLRKQKGSLETYKKGMMQKIFRQEVRFKDKNGKVFPKWEGGELGRVCTIRTGKLDANAMKEGGRYRFYTCAREYFQIDDYAFDTEALLISGNGANVGYIHYYKGKFNAYQRTYVLDKFSVDIQFIKYFLEQNLSQRIDNEKKAGNTPYIVMGTLHDMWIMYPTIQEQKKIADFLSAIDNLIEAKQKQISLAEQWKKGLMQQMFI